MELNVDWSANTHLDLKQEVAQLKPITSGEVQVPYFNILLVGPVGAGKSSFFNTIKSTFRGHITSQAVAGEAAHSLTSIFRRYEVSSYRDINPFHWRICDTMGLQGRDISYQFLDRAVLELVADGCVRDHSSMHMDIFYYFVAWFTSNPTLSEKMHCVALVIDASKVRIIQPHIWREMRTFQDAMNTRRIPLVAILTKIDKACTDDTRDVTRITQDAAIRYAVDKVSAELQGLQRNKIFPVKNYESETVPDQNLEILILLAVRQMLRFSQDFVEEKIAQMQTESKLLFPTYRNLIIAIVISCSVIWFIFTKVVDV